MLATGKGRTQALLAARRAHVSNLDEDERLAAEDEIHVVAELTALLLAAPSPAAPGAAAPIAALEP